MTTKTKFNFCP